MKKTAKSSSGRRKTSRPHRAVRRRDDDRSPAQAEDAGMAAQLMGAQRRLWQAGVDAFARGRKAGAALNTSSITESLQGGLKKLEDVFDQRVLTSLAHAGMPSPAEIRELMERVETLSAEVSRLSHRLATKK